MHQINLTKYCFIKKLNKNSIDNLDNNTIIIYRNYEKKNFEKEILKIKKYLRKTQKKLYLSNNFKLAIKLKLDGVYIPSFNKSLKHLSFSLKKNFKIVGSAHNLKEIRLKEFQKVSAIFISSLFKENKNYLGFNKFLLMRKHTLKPVIALGGISKSNVKKVKLLKCKGFSGISYFEQKKRPYF